MSAVTRKNKAASSFEPVHSGTAWPHSISRQVFSSHSIVLSPWVVRPCSPRKGRWIGH